MLNLGGEDFGDEGGAGGAGGGVASAEALGGSGYCRRQDATT